MISNNRQETNISEIKVDSQDIAYRMTSFLSSNQHKIMQMMIDGDCIAEVTFEDVFQKIDELKTDQNCNICLSELVSDQKEDNNTDKETVKDAFNILLNRRHEIIRQLTIESQSRE